jgi:hypothetical protein
MVVTEGEQGQVRMEEPFGEMVSHDYSDLTREQVRFLARILPYGRAPILTVSLAE